MLVSLSCGQIYVLIFLLLVETSLAFKCPAGQYSSGVDWPGFTPYPCYQCPYNSGARCGVDRDCIFDVGCHPCNPGYWGIPTLGCNACPANTGDSCGIVDVCSDLNLGYQDQCKCNAGFYGYFQSNLLLGRGWICTACPPNSGGSCSGSACSTQSSCSCNAGFQGTSGGTCTACVPGKYASSGGSSECASCETGKYSTLVGATACTDCGAGKYSASTSESAASVCADCGAGKYSAVVGATTSSTCITCTTFAITNYPGSTSINDCFCLAGYTVINNANISSGCKACTVNTYRVGSATHSPCTECPTFSTSPVASTSVDDCIPDAGYIMNITTWPLTTAPCVAGTYSLYRATTCTACPVNSTSPVLSSVLANCTCNAGFSGPNGGLCSACVSGKYKAAAGSATCTSCGAGRYSAAGASVCANCTAGFTSPVQSSSSAFCYFLEPCGAGSSGPNGGPCVLCSLGYYKNTTGSAACVACVGAALTGGTYSDTAGAANCTECPANAVSANLSASTSCVCTKGYYVRFGPV